MASKGRPGNFRAEAKPLATKKTKKSATKPPSKKREVASAAKRKLTPGMQAIADGVLTGLRALVVNLERRPDRWERISAMLQRGTPWLHFERFLASDGTKDPIPEADVATTWSTSRNARFRDYYEWVYDAPGTPLDGKMWKWAAEVEDEDDEWKFLENAEEDWSYVLHSGQNGIRDGKKEGRTAVIENKATGETFNLKLIFANEYVEPGETMRLSGGERGCAHSHLRIWRAAAERTKPTLVLEDDATFDFDREGTARFNGGLFTERLALAIKHVPEDFDVIYLGWSGWRGGNNKFWVMDPKEARSRAWQYVRRAEYVWTTVAYVISQAGAKKLLAQGLPLYQPVDNLMAWEASEGRLKSYVALDGEDDDNTWAGGIIDQFDFMGDTDIKKSDGGDQGHDAAEFALARGA